MVASAAALRQPTSLPTVLTPVVGRDADLDRVLALIDEPSNRLITLTGPGGVGKTRLALHIAATLIDEFERDVVYVPLAAIRDAELVLPTIGQALGVTVAATDSWEDRLVGALGERQSLLLVLDNFEQLLDAALSVANLLARCPETTILITSQAALGIAGEQLYPLPPLPTPAQDQTTADAIMRADAVALFVARAQAVKPTIVIDDRSAMTIAEICRRLDGLPLAIELAAARVNILSPNALLARLSNRLQVLQGERRGVPDRLRTMRHAIAWSYELLTPAEQELFRRMSVFAGGFSLEAAEALFAVGDDQRDAWTVLSVLVDHSLVQAASHPAGDVRFLILETLRDYGLEQLDLRGETDVARKSHAMYFLELSETAEPRILGIDQELWLKKLESEWENLRTAMEWSLQAGEEVIVLRILSAIRRFCTARGHVTESRGFLERALAATSADQSMSRCRGLIAAGNLAEDQGDLDIAQRYFTQSRDIAIGLGDKTNEAMSLIGLGYVAHDRGDYAAALDSHGRAATLGREIDDRRCLGTALGNLASVSYFRGNLDAARRYWEESGQIFRALGDHLTEALAIGNLGSVAAEQGDFDLAERLQRKVLALQRRLGNAPNIALALINLADISQHLGDFTLANDQLSEAIPILRELGLKGQEGIGLNTLAAATFAQGDAPRAAAIILESVRLLSEVGDQLSIAGNTDLLARICEARESHGVAIELMAAAAALRGRLGSVANTVNQAEIDALAERLRMSVSAGDFERHWQAGSGLDLGALTRRIVIVAREIVGPLRPRPVLPEPVAPEPEHNLTNREIEVLRLLTEGSSTRDISGALFISPRTATTHINNIFVKLEVSSRSAAVAWAMRAGLG